jgi:hypothetical protein
MLFFEFMGEKDFWQVDHYKAEAFMAKVKLERLQRYIQFLEEKYRIRSMENFKDEFDKWCEENY